MKGHLGKILLALLGLLAVAGFVGWRRIHFQAEVGAGYVARELCGCVFIAGRSVESCLPDLPPDMAPVRAELLEGEPGVYARVPLFAWRTARYEPKTGCTLD